jgi:hypothetical protein
MQHGLRMRTLWGVVNGRRAKIRNGILARRAAVTVSKLSPGTVNPDQEELREKRIASTLISFATDANTQSVLNSPYIAKYRK